MLLGSSWVIEHLRQTHRRGNTAAGRVWACRVREEEAVLTFQCDRCGESETVGSQRLDRMRHVAKKALIHEERWGVHLCPTCAAKAANEKARETKRSEGWRESRKETPSWQSEATPEKLRRWRAKGRRSRIRTNAAKTPEERRVGVLKQWASMSEIQKEERARKIGRWSRGWWAALTPEQRIIEVKKRIKGLPRSAVSEEFKNALLDAGLYTGFHSEEGISGFVVDEANHQKKLVLEFYGDYYHCNPRVFSPDFYNPTTRKTAIQQWKYDRRRLAALRKAGYRTLVLWESTWKNDPDSVLSKVAEFVGVSLKKIPRSKD